MNVAEMPPIEVDVVVRGIRFEPSTSVVIGADASVVIGAVDQAPVRATVAALGAALAIVDGWTVTDDSTEAFYVRRAHKVMDLLRGLPMVGSFHDVVEPIWCSATGQGIRLSPDQPAPVLRCSLFTGHTGEHKTRDGTLFETRGG